jgi:hypothetical protein
MAVIFATEIAAIDQKTNQLKVEQPFTELRHDFSEYSKWKSSSVREVGQSVSVRAL